MEMKDFYENVLRVNILSLNGTYIKPKYGNYHLEETLGIKVDRKPKLQFPQIIEELK